SWHRRLAAAVAAERPGRGKLAELVPDHVLLHEHAEELVPVVDLKRMAHEFRDNRASARPRFERLLGPDLIQHGNLFVELLVYIRAFFCAATHCICPLSVVRGSLSVLRDQPLTTDN